MNVFDVLREKLGKCKDSHLRLADDTKEMTELQFAGCYTNAIEIVNQVEQEYNNGWIPVSERYPDNDGYILISFENFSLPDVGRYEEDAEGGAFYPGDDSESYVHHGLIVNAWRPLPVAYKEGMVTTNAERIRNMTDEQLADEMLKFTDVCEEINFCHNDQLCNDTLDRGEFIEKEMCKRCLMNWLGKEA